MIRYAGFFIIIVFSLISIILSYSNIPILSILDEKFLDYRQNKIRIVKKSNDIVLIAVDDRSIQKLGSWPLPRNTWAKLLDKLRIAKAKTVAFDILFDERSPYKGHEVLFVKAIKNFTKSGGSVILPYGLTIKNARKDFPEVLYNNIIDTHIKDNTIEVKKISKYSFPIDILAKQKISLGHVQAQASIDGIFRNYQLVGNVNNIFLPSLALATYKAHTNDKVSLKLKDQDTYLKTSKGIIPINMNGETRIIWNGSSDAFEEISLYDALNSNIKLKDKIIVIGSTAYAAHDLRHSPISSILPGSYYHINMIDMLINSRFMKSPVKSEKLSIAILLISILFILLFFKFFKNPFIDIIVVSSFIYSIYIYDLNYLTPKGHSISLSICLHAILFIYLWNTFIKYNKTRKDRQYLKDSFKSYISPALINKMLKHNIIPTLGGETAKRTAFFTDIENFSNFSEKIPPTELVNILNIYLTKMTNILMDQGGTLDKYQGDAIVAFFGAPIPMKDHSLNSCITAYKMQKEMVNIRKEFKDHPLKEIRSMKTRIGINSGNILTGNIGSSIRMNYTMIGDAVNIAARLETSCKYYGIYTHASLETKESSKDEFLWREIDNIKVVGKDLPIKTFELLEKKENASEELKQLVKIFNEGIKYYKSRKFKDAILCFEESLRKEHLRFEDFTTDTSPSKIYIERCKYYQKNTPSTDWDGVYILENK